VLEGHRVGLRDGADGGELADRAGQISVGGGAQLEVAVLAEHRERLLDRLACGVGTDGPQPGAGVGDERSGQLLAVVHLAGHGHRLRRARQRGIEPVEQVEGVGAEGQELGAHAGREPRGLTQHDVEMLHGLPMRPRRGSLAGGDGPGGEEQLGVVAAGGVMHDPRRIRAVIVQVPGQLAVDAHPLGGDERVLDGLANELVPEPDVGDVPGQDPAALAMRPLVGRSSTGRTTR
jgi:hypothetical protein